MSLTGTTLGQYRIADHLGRGGMADVYKAYHEGLAVYRAIKVVRSELATEGDFKARFQTEAKAVAMLRHPNIVQVQDFCADDGVYYMVMEYVEGKNLKECVQEDGPIRPIARAVTMIGQIASALNYAHEQGIIHRDIKPQNIILNATGDPVLTDFGIAKLTASNAGLTQTGMSIGTPSYMAPEQALGDANVGPAADIYSLTVVLYEALTGKVPFDADTPLATMLKIISDPLPMPREACGEISESLQKVILKGMAREPKNRYATALDFKSALERAVDAGDSMDTTVVLNSAAPSSKDATAVQPKRKQSAWQSLGRSAGAALLLLVLTTGVVWMFDSSPSESGIIERREKIASLGLTATEKNQKAAEIAAQGTLKKAGEERNKKEIPAANAALVTPRTMGSLQVDTIRANNLVVGDASITPASLAGNSGKGGAGTNGKSDRMNTKTVLASLHPAITQKPVVTKEAQTNVATPQKSRQEARPSTITLGALTLNESATGLPLHAGQKARYTFEEYAGETLFLDDKSSDGERLNYRLIAPDGRTIVFSENQDSGPWQLPQSGTYVLEVVAQSNQTSNFEFVLWRLFPAVIDDGEVTLNRYTTNATRYPGQKVVYTFYADEGQRVYFDEQNIGEEKTEYRLIAPDRRTIVFEVRKDTGPLTLPQSGTYLLEIDPMADNTVEFAFVLRKQ